jgi:hypothetical protein
MQRREAEYRKQPGAHPSVFEAWDSTVVSLLGSRAPSKQHRSRDDKFVPPEKQKAGRLSPAFRSEKLSIAELS